MSQDISMLSLAVFFRLLFVMAIEMPSRFVHLVLGDVTFSCDTALRMTMLAIERLCVSSGGPAVDLTAIYMNTVRQNNKHTVVVIAQCHSSHWHFFRDRVTSKKRARHQQRHHVYRCLSSLHSWSVTGLVAEKYNTVDLTIFCFSSEHPLA